MSVKNQSLQEVLDRAKADEKNLVLETVDKTQDACIQIVAVEKSRAYRRAEADVCKKVDELYPKVDLYKISAE